MTTCLITGCNGFIGSQLAEFIIQKELAVYGTIRRDRSRINHLAEMTILDCDILDKEKLKTLMVKVKPDIVFHLAAQSKVDTSWQDPELTIKVNILGTLYLLEAVKLVCPNSIVLVVGAAAIYGSSKDQKPIDENHGMTASSPYAISKIAQDYISELYCQAYGLKIIRIRPFNITGAGNVGDASSDFAKGIAMIEKGHLGFLNVGDLNSVRDVTNVKDAIEALWLLAKRGVPGNVYNLCSGIGYRIGDLLTKLIGMSSVDIKVAQDTSKKRVLVDNFQIGDNSKLRTLGWSPTVSIDRTLSETLDYWRRN